ncbi:MAG: phosphotransferase family protein [Acidobacteriota bacterium]
MSDFVDAPRPVREGEELDLERLGAHLDEHLDPALGAGDGPVEVEQFPSGYSNLTYLLRKGELEMVLRRPPFGNRVKSAHDMGREHRVLSALQGAYAPAPRPYLLCEDEDVLGAPFYIMERRRGVVLRARVPRGLELPPVLVQRLCESFVDRLVELHCLDADAIGLGDLGRPEGYVERQVHGWMKRYERAQTDSWPEFDQVGAWLASEVATSGDGGAALIHNDYKYDNLLLDPDDLHRIVGVLDWEMCTLGDPRMDLGTTLAYWVEPGDPEPLRNAAFGPTALPGSLDRRQLAERWAAGMERAGGAPALDDLVFFYAFGLYKLGVIVQQIYYRYFKGHTQDPRFAQINQLVGLLGRVGAAAIERGSI